MRSLGPCIPINPVLGCSWAGVLADQGLWDEGLQYPSTGPSATSGRPLPLARARFPQWPDFPAGPPLALQASAGSGSLLLLFHLHTLLRGATPPSAWPWFRGGSEGTAVAPPPGGVSPPGSSPHLHIPAKRRGIYFVCKKLIIIDKCI